MGEDSVSGTGLTRTLTEMWCWGVGRGRLLLVLVVVVALVVVLFWILWVLGDTWRLSRVFVGWFGLLRDVSDMEAAWWVALVVKGSSSTSIFYRYTWYILKNIEANFVFVDYFI